MTMRADAHTAALIRLVKDNATSRGVWDVWRDFLEVSSLAVANAVDHHPERWQEREDQYLRTMGRWDAEEQKRFAAMFVELGNALEIGMDDVLGRVFMELELGNKWAGQFFTPYEVSRAMAMMTVADMAPEIERKGWVTACEPACGAGGMIIALADALRGEGINYQQQLHVTAVDVDIKAVHMTYLQLSLLHIPAVVVHGNALSLETWSQWYTPAHVLGGWSWKLQERQAENDIPHENGPDRGEPEAPGEPGDAPMVPPAAVEPHGQLLFDFDLEATG